MPNKEIHTLIFDLGGVIVDLSIPDTLKAFEKLSGYDRDKVHEIFYSTSEFEHFEKGLLSDDQFRDFVRRTFSTLAPNEVIDEAWNAMILGLPVEKLQLLENLKKKYQVLLLSNTNDIHLRFINQQVLPRVTEVKDLDQFFHYAYYSHRVGKRKPDAEIFEYVLNEHKLDVSRTLFLDDNQLNIESASSLGIQTILITHPDLVYEIFSDQSTSGN